MKNKQLLEMLCIQYPKAQDQLYKFLEEEEQKLINKNKKWELLKNQLQ